MHLDHPSRGSRPVPGAAAGFSSGDPDADALLRGIVGGTDAGIVVLDPRLRVTRANAAFARMAGLPAADLVGRSADQLPGGSGDDPGLLRSVLRDGRPRAVSTPSSAGPSSAGARTWWHAVYHRFEADGRTRGVVGIVVETAAPHAPDAEPVPDRELVEARARLALLDDAALRVGTTLDPELTCQQLAEFAVPRLADAALVEVVPPGFAERGRFAAEGITLNRAALSTVPSLADALAPL